MENFCLGLQQVHDKLISLEAKNEIEIFNCAEEALKLCTVFTQNIFDNVFYLQENFKPGFFRELREIHARVEVSINRMLIQQDISQRLEIGYHLRNFIGLILHPEKTGLQMNQVS